MRHILRNAIFSIAIVAISLYAMFPLDKQIRLGKDLRGGVSLVYGVQIRPGDNAADVLNRTIEVLKNRVDPNGMMEISIVAQGRDRIEVTMPLPGQRVKALKAAYEATLKSIEGKALTPADIDRISRATPDERPAQIAAAAAGDQAQADRITAAVAAFDASQAARGALREAEAAGRPENELDALAAAVATAESAFEAARDTAVRANLSASDVRQALMLSDRSRQIMDENGNSISLPSARDRAIERIRQSHPEAGAQLDQIIAAFTAFEAERTSLEDSSDLKRLLRGAGVLSFRITCDLGEHPSEQALREELRKVGPRNAKANDAAWYKINQVENWYDSVAAMRRMEADPAGYFGDRGYVAESYDGEFYILCWNTRATRLTQEDGPWGIASAFQSTDEVGRRAISFEMDARGASRLGELTRGHVGDQMAVLLDDEIYTAPNLNSAISRNGIIQGEFSEQEINYVVRVLTAGSLAARLSPEPISENTLGPELGADNLRQGVTAGQVSLIAIAVFMIGYYFLLGGIAVFGLICTSIIIVGAMALNKAAFTLPGIAGIVLTFGQAVDANVLIFERMREELERGEDMKSAVKLGHSKAFSSIFDGNVTNLIVCFVLAYTGTPEIKGFAITLGIGIVATLISALIITRVIFDVAVNHGAWRRTTMLPMVCKPLARVLTPNIDWIGMRPIYITLSTVFTVGSLAVIVAEGGRLLDTEFTGGTQVTLRMGEGPDGAQRTMTRAEVEERARKIGIDAGSETSLSAMRSAEVLPINAEPDGVTASTFIVRTTSTDQSGVVGSLADAFRDVLDTKPALTFAGADAKELRDAPVYEIFAPRLGENVDRPELLDDVTPFLGGVAIVIEGIEPARPLADIQDRLETLRGQPDFSDTLLRKREVRVLEGTPDAVRSVVVLVADPGVSFFDSEEQWRSAVAEREWKLVTAGLTTSTTLAEVRSFSPAVAESFKAKAVTALMLSIILIGIYIWVRFGSILYSTAAVACLVHNTIVCMGFVALASWLFRFEGLQPTLQTLGVMPFKVDLNLIAAVLTVIGFSLNDNIIIMDRIRENRGSLKAADRRAINAGINQTISRTIITSGTTVISVMFLYAFGGPGVRSFSYVMLVGVFVAIYSSVAVAAPIVWSRKSERAAAAAAGSSPALPGA